MQKGIKIFLEFFIFVFGSERFWLIFPPNYIAYFDI